MKECSLTRWNENWTSCQQQGLSCTENMDVLIIKKIKKIIKNYHPIEVKTSWFAEISFVIREFQMIEET